uniref:Uncharacterized protein isoform X2 n=1 Tax=Pogona vitticeps TaxID=103695 RepID=A0ABM5FGN9_9SAUR
MAEAGRWGRWQEVKKEAEKGLQQRWEAQWQEFLEMLEPSSRRGEKPVISEAAPWDDAKAFLASFEEVANACQWPKEEWVTRLLPALHGEAEEAFQSLGARDREDYGKVKAAILRGDALRMEVRRQHFRDFSCQEVEDPRRLHSQVQELCHRWLRPERRSKEQILELLILEQFLASLPPDLQGWIRAGGPDTCSQAVALVDDFLISQEGAERAKWQGLMVAKETCPSLLKSHQDLTQPSSQTVFWQVLQEGGETVDSLDDTMGRQVKMEDPQWERNELIDVPRTAAPASQVNRMKRIEIGEEECGLKEDQSAERDKGRNEFRDHLVDTVCQPSKMSTREETPTTLKYGRRYPCKSESDCICTRKKHNECVTSEEKFQENVYSDKQQSVVTGEIKPECLENVEGDRLDTYRCDCPEEDPKDSASGESHDIQSEGRLFECSHCRKGFLQRRSLVIHQKSHTGEKLYKCSQCGKCFSYQGNLIRHRRIHTGEKRYTSLECGKSFGRNNHLKTHQIIHTGEKLYECSQCGKCFSQRKYLNTHQLLHTGAKPYKCSQCGKCFSLGKYLKKHQRIHTASETKPHKCSQCGKSFNQEKALLVHQRIHTGEKPYKCSQCGKCFNHQRNLRSHWRIHSGEKRYTCLECGKSFRQNNHLKIHQIIHTGEKPYKCSQCGKCFNQQGNLRSHWRIHTGEKPHTCLECGKSFGRSSHLKTHQIIHTGERP